MSAHDSREDRLPPEAEETLALVAHEIRAPLTVISGYLELLQRRPLDETARARALAEARKAAGRIERLLDDLAAATGPQTLLAPAEFVPVSLAALAGEAASVFTQISEHEVSVDADGPGTVVGDSSLLARAIENLVTNAIVHSPEGGAVAISVSADAGRITLAVEDEGAGIPADARELVFGRFERLDATSPERPGTGLGLYIVRGIVEAHGGTVRAGSGTGGRGTRMVLELPAAPPA